MLAPPLHRNARRCRGAAQAARLRARRSRGRARPSRRVASAIGRAISSSALAQPILGIDRCRRARRALGSLRPARRSRDRDRTRRLPRRIEVAPLEQLRTPRRARSAADLRGRSPRAGAAAGAGLRPARRAPARTSARTRFRTARRRRLRARPRTPDRRAPRPAARAADRRRTNGSCRCAPLRAPPARREMPRALVGGCVRIAARALDLLAQPELQLAGGLLGERHRDDPAKLARARRDHRDDAVDQLGGLAGAGRRLDDQRGIEVVADAIAHALVGRRISRGIPLSVRALRSSLTRSQPRNVRREARRRFDAHRAAPRTDRRPAEVAPSAFARPARRAGSPPRARRRRWRRIRSAAARAVSSISTMRSS